MICKERLVRAITQFYWFRRISDASFRHNAKIIQLTMDFGDHHERFSIWRQPSLKRRTKTTDDYKRTESRYGGP
jgi:hypothetical protein